MLRVALAGALSLGLSVLTSDVNAGDSVVTFISDPTWLASSQLPDGSLGPVLGEAQCICLSGRCPCCWTGNTGAIPGACWLWKPGTKSSTVPVDLEGAYLSKTLEVPGYPDGGTLYFAADDFAEVRVNGAVARTIGSVSDYGSAAGAQAQLTRVDITPLLVAGLNQVIVHVQNGPGWFTGTSCNPCSFGQNPTGAIVGGSITYFAAVSTMQRSWGMLKTIYR